MAAVLITAPNLLLLPLGFGLFLLFNTCGLKLYPLTRIQTLLFAYFVGLFVIILFFVASERYFGKYSRPDILIFPIWCLSLLGLLRLRRLFVVSRDAWRQILVFIAIAGSLTVVRYCYSLVIYSQFPVTDLFQRVQFHGGAWEFSRNLELNPFVAASYIPYQQLQLGLLLRLTGADPLVAEWIWPIAMAPLQAAAIYALFSKLFSQRRACLLASAIALSQLSLTNPTNGTMAELASVTLMSFLLSRAQPTTSPRSNFAIKWGAISGGILLGLALNRLPLEIVLLSAAGLLVLNRIALSSTHLSLFAPLLTLSAVTLTFHRGALLYVVLGTTAVMGYKYLVSTTLFSQARNMQILRVSVVTIFAVVAVTAGTVLVIGKTAQTDTFGLFWIFDIILIPLTGKSLALVAGDGDLAPGVGARVALFELARAVSPFLLFIITSYSILKCIPLFRNYRSFSLDARDRHVLTQALITFVIISLILTGFPFIHRAAFLVTLLVSASATNIFLSIRFNRTNAIVALTLVTAYAMVVVAGAYVVAPHRVEPYLDRASSIFIMLGVTLAVVLLIPVVGLARRRWKLGGILVLCIATEIALVTTYFKSYAFNNQPPPSAGPYASFDKRDLALAEFVNKYIDQSDVIVSDPKTMTFIRARTGRYSLLSTSNLDTVSPNQRSTLVSLMRRIVSGETEAICNDLMTTLDKGASSIRNYDHAREITSFSGKSVLARLGYDNRLVPSYDPELKTISPEELFAKSSPQTFVIIVSHATIDWLESPETLRYFPRHERLAASTLTKLYQTFPDHMMFDETLIAELICR